MKGIVEDGFVEEIELQSLQEEFSAILQVSPSKLKTQKKMIR
jgi:hypothetical protein